MSVTDLPAINATLNGISATLLAAGWVFIKRDNRAAHRNCMIGAFCVSTVFLCCYLYYHAHAGHTTFRDPAWFRPFYLGLLISHVLLAAAIVPMILMTLNHAWRERFDAHKRIARWTLPLWMYVSVTGVLIYLLLYQVFPQQAVQ